jgi:hypothetical protein
VDPVVYQEAIDALNKQEAKLRKGLSRVDRDLSLALRVVRIAKELASEISASYDQATPAIRALLAQAFFEKFEVLDGTIVRANLNAPVEYVLDQNLRRHPVFELAPSGGATRSLLEHPMWLWEPGNARVIGLLEKAYEALRSDHGLKAA